MLILGKVYHPSVLCNSESEHHESIIYMKHVDNYGTYYVLSKIMYGRASVAHGFRSSLIQHNT